MGIVQRNYFFFCFLFICQTHFSYSKNVYSNATCNENEQRALTQFKQNLVDDGNRLSSWIGKNCCNWYGVACNNRTGRVEKLDLHDPDRPPLGGRINPSLLNLEHLHYLDLSLNDFSGIPIPTFLGSFKNLRYLSLSTAGFGGEIPPHLGNLSNLLLLNLSNANAGGSFHTLSANNLDWISGLASLKDLDLSSVHLNASRNWLFSVNMLPSLSSLTLRACGLAGEIPSLRSPVNLTSLLSLDLGENALNSTLPVWMFNLSSLQELKLDSNNMLHGPFFPVPGKFTSLTVLDLSFNSFGFVMSDSFCNQTSLVYMNLGFNQFQGLLPPCIGNLTSLREIYLSNNQFYGIIPSELGNLKQLTVLLLDKNYFNSPIPSSFGQLAKLESLYLSHNQLYGVVPSTIGQLVNLQFLDISENSLTGVLSESTLANLRSLQVLTVSKNYILTFNVSSHWIAPFQIREIISDSAMLGPEFLPWLRSQRNLQWLSMRNASSRGSLISFPHDITYLDLSNNFLTGPILLFHDNYTTNSSLIYLDLGNNNLTGSIPDYLCNLSALATLSLANNRLTGRIPPCLGNLLQLQVLNLANNSFSGHIPSTLGNLERLYFLHLNRNRFHGVFPSSFKSLKSLVTLDLGENQLTDTVPEWIGKELSSLVFLRLQSNDFRGNIPLQFCQLSFLQVLNLADNNLDGHIPHCFNNLSYMKLSNGVGKDGGFSAYNDALWNIMKGTELEYTSNLWYIKSMSLSGNNIDGAIPDELMDLDGLQSLTLSNNRLSGRIPDMIGNLKQLESLDLAWNQLSGPIPQSIADIDSLGYLDLSFNNLWGRIPSGNHFDTFNNQSIYEGNSGLCGKQIAKPCPDDPVPLSKGNGAGFDERNDRENELEFPWFYAGLGPGFGVGLSGVFCILHFKKSWRGAYFDFVENVCERFSVAITATVSWLQRKFASMYM